jgi:ligand-binding sensor domain-containing protein
VWGITEEGAAAYNGREWETYTPDNSGLASENVRSIVVDGRGAVWFATDKGISRLEP